MMKLTTPMRPRTMSKEDRQKKAEDREARKRKKCRDSRPDQKTCSACSMSGKCVTEGTHDWLNDQNVPDEPDEPEKTQD